MTHATRHPPTTHTHVSAPSTGTCTSCRIAARRGVRTSRLSTAALADVRERITVGASDSSSFNSASTLLRAARFLRRSARRSSFALFVSYAAAVRFNGWYTPVAGASPSPASSSSPLAPCGNSAPRFGLAASSSALGARSRVGDVTCLRTSGAAVRTVQSEAGVQFGTAAFLRPPHFPSCHFQLCTKKSGSYNPGLSMVLDGVF